MHFIARSLICGLVGEFGFRKCFIIMLDMCSSRKHPRPASSQFTPRPRASPSRHRNLYRPIAFIFFCVPLLLRCSKADKWVGALNVHGGLGRCGRAAQNTCSGTIGKTFRLNRELLRRTITYEIIGGIWTNFCCKVIQRHDRDIWG